MWYIGQKVVCVDPDSPGSQPADQYATWLPGEAPVKDAIYTVKSVHKNKSGALSFHFFEISRSLGSVIQHGPLVGYGVWRFRPLLDKKTDITIFTDILKSVKEPENV